MARVLGLEALRMADADVLPYDYVTYAREISAYIDAAKRKAADAGARLARLRPGRGCRRALHCRRAKGARRSRSAPSGDSAQPESGPARRPRPLCSRRAGLPNRPWYKHTIYAPGEYTGYAAVVIPGVNEAIDARNATVAARQFTVLTQALDRAASALNNAR